MNSIKFYFLSCLGILFLVSNIYSHSERFDERLLNHSNRYMHSKHKNITDFLNKEMFRNQTFKYMREQDFDSTSVVDSIITKDPNGKNSYRHVYTYDSNWNIILHFEEIWNGSQWVNSMRYTNTYDSDDYLITELTESWGGSQWVNDGRNTFTYSLDSARNKATYTAENWDGSQWVKDSRHTFTYDLNWNIISWLWEIWDDSHWVNLFLLTWNYDSNGIEISSFLEIWDDGQWVLDLRSTYTYDSNGNQILDLSESWDGNQWVLDMRDTYTYDSNGNRISRLFESWDGGQWIIIRRSTYTYDSNGNLITKLEQFWNRSRSQWINNWRDMYTYDSNGNMTFGKCEEWANGNWIAAEGYILFCDSFGREFGIGCAEIYVYYSILTDVAESNVVINEFSLSQNYPNPFNPVTNIDFVLCKASDVKLEIYNLHGQQVAVPINEYKLSGFYTIQFDAGHLPSGLYIYYLRAGEFKKGRKMLLAK